MAVFTRDFFKNDEVLIIGYSSKTKSFCRRVAKGISNAGITIYALNHNKSDNFDMKVFQSISELPKIPQTAYVILNPENTAKAVKGLKNSGIKNIMFQPGTVTSETKEECVSMGMEVIEACPLMVFGKGIHRIHGFFAGLKK